jgi:hypothetical protein
MYPVGIIPFPVLPAILSQLFPLRNKRYIRYQQDYSLSLEAARTYQLTYQLIF